MWEPSIIRCRLPFLLSPVGKELAGICGASSCRCPAPQSWGCPERRWSWSPKRTLCGWAFCAGPHIEKLARYCCSPEAWMLYSALSNCRLEAPNSCGERTVAHMGTPFWRKKEESFYTTCINKIIIVYHWVIIQCMCYYQQKQRRVWYSWNI